MQPSNVCREAAGGKHAGPGAGQRACAEHAHVVFHHPLAPLLALEPGRRCRLGPCCCCCCAASCRCRRRRGGPGGHCAAAVTAILCLHVVFRAPGKGSMPGSARQREHARQNVTVKIDATKPGLPPSQGSLHPASAQAPMVVAVPCAGTCYDAAALGTTSPVTFSWPDVSDVRFFMSANRAAIGLPPPLLPLLAAAAAGLRSASSAPGGGGGGGGGGPPGALGGGAGAAAGFAAAGAAGPAPGLKSEAGMPPAFQAGPAGKCRAQKACRQRALGRVERCALATQNRSHILCGSASSPCPAPSAAPAAARSVLPQAQPQAGPRACPATGPGPVRTLSPASRSLRACTQVT